ncbi:MAG: hypothetical protein IPM53_13765 [Anaerolineaceae bacterium]|nr:hypothetical protein [Anaerolineaceae bacterium]
MAWSLRKIVHEMSLDKALRNATKFFGEENEKLNRLQYERIQMMPGSRQMFKRIASAPDIEQLMDYLAEVRYALVFAGLNFDVEIEPFGKKGPDLQIAKNGNRAIVEVKRFRKVYSGPPELDINNPKTMLVEYGNITRDVRKAFNIILTKFDQIGNSDAIIAVWNDDEDLDDWEVSKAVQNIRLDSKNNKLAVPSNLAFVVYGSKWIGDQNQQLYCFPIHQRHSPYLLWCQELDSSIVSDLVHKAIGQS